MHLYATTLLLLHFLQKTAIKEGVKLDSAALALEFENRLLKDKLNDITRYNHSLVRHAFLNEDNLVAAVVRGEAANNQILQLSVQALNSDVSYRQRAAELVSTTELCFLYTRII
jgi:restriction endonuclease